MSDRDISAVIERWRHEWALRQAKARLRSAKAVWEHMPFGPFYDSAWDDDTYYRNSRELTAAEDALAALQRPITEVTEP